MSDVWCQTFYLTHLVSDVWCLMSDVSCQMSDLRRLKSHVWYQTSDVTCLMSDVWCMMSDIRCLRADVWFQISDVGRLQSDVWYQTSDVTCLMSDVWCVICLMSNLRCLTSYVRLLMSNVWCQTYDYRRLTYHLPTFNTQTLHRNPLYLYSMAMTMFGDPRAVNQVGKNCSESFQERARETLSLRGWAVTGTDIKKGFFSSWKPGILFKVL